MSRLFDQIFGDSAGEPNIGSGVIVSSDGYILTNWHLTEGAVRIKVTHEDKEWEAVLIGEDPQTDLALIKVDGRNLPFITFGNSFETQVGDFVFSIGNPFGLGQTVSMGIVSALQGGEGEFADYMQTDAGIHPGSSGGALINKKGELIGINSAFLWSENTGNQGIGFALPSNTVSKVFEELRKHGFVMRASLGVELQDVTPLIGKAFFLNPPCGALVADLTPAGPGDRAGIQRGDIIVEFNRSTVRNAHGLNLQIAQLGPRTIVEMKIFREAKWLVISATLDRSPGIHINDSKPVQPNLPLDGVEVEEITPDIRAALFLPKSVIGVIVTFINKDSPAFAAGLMTADVIQELNHTKISNLQQFEQAIRPEKRDEKVMLLLVRRDGHTKYVALDY